MSGHANRLAKETSPYLRQHMHNPVDWYPWGDEALERARREDLPILLSIGYSACHWCHVMERECFENPTIAQLMNQLFVSVKVDREERPDIDHTYMSAVQVMTGRGGWPLTVFLTPNGEPFYGGTYFPPEDRHNIPGFPRVLAAVARAYRERPDDIRASVEQLIARMRQLDRYEPAGASSPDHRVVLGAAGSLAAAYDPEYGGIGDAPKFPNVSVMDLFLRAHHAGGAGHYLDMVTHSLRRMADGGIRDHLGGGFHRYSVDRRWLVPHFEKMLYDNAQLASLYIDASLASGDSFFAEVAEDILGYLTREMRDPEGGFYSTQDADSEGEEGKFFLWTAGECRRVLGNDAELFCRYYDVIDEGNFEGRNILHVTLTIEQLATLFRIDPGAARHRLGEARAKLLAARERRVKPGLDDKILTSWNGLTVSAFARAAEAFGNPAYLDTARAAAGFIFRRLWYNEGLLSTYRGGTAKIDGFLDDYAFVAAGLVDLFEASRDDEYCERACRLADIMLGRFWDAANGGFFFSGRGHDRLIVRTKPAFDGSLPSGNSTAARVLLRLYHHCGKALYLERAEETLRLFQNHAREHPLGFANMLAALDYFTRGPKEIVVLGQAHAADTRDFVARIGRLYIPNRCLRVADPARGGLLPPLEGKGQVDGKATVYVCHRMTCSPPATSWKEVEPLLA